MKTLMIKDLSANVELDSKAMAAVSGGLYLGRYAALTSADRSCPSPDGHRHHVRRRFTGPGPGDEREHSNRRECRLR